SSRAGDLCADRSGARIRRARAIDRAVGARASQGLERRLPSRFSPAPFVVRVQGTTTLNRQSGARMKLDIYVNYPGTCEAAFRFYERHIGGKITLMTTHEGQPNPNIPADWKNKILHARLEIGSAVLMGADIPGAEPMRSAYVTLRVDSAQEAERLYALLGEGGQIFMKMEQTFFANRFAMLRDRFGTSWML